MEPIAAILLGLAGGFHCLGMCGPIALALPVQRTTKQNVARVLYQFGRIFTYAVLGAVVGLGATTVSIVATESVVSITAGSLMIVAALAQLSFHRSIIPSAPLLRITSPVRAKLQYLLQKNTFAAMTGIGMLNGLLPCGLVIAALFGAASTGDVIQGSVFMSFFGLGTLPVMTAVMFGVGVISQRLRAVLKTAIPVVAIAVGALLVVRGMGLGIPYVSPRHVVVEQVVCCPPGEHAEASH
jgi:uncharacterized protein